jgi:hypothetical protein
MQCLQNDFKFILILTFWVSDLFNPAGIPVHPYMMVLPNVYQSLTSPIMSTRYGIDTVTNVYKERVQSFFVMFF